MPQLLRAVVFDLDGTLIDSAPDIWAAANVMLGAAGRRTVTLEEIKMFVGDGVPKLVERAFAATGEALDEAALKPEIARFMAYYEAHPADLSQPFPGARHVLERCRAAGLKTAVCTNKPQQASLSILSAFDLLPLVDTVLGGDVLAVKKPAPDPLCEVLRRLGVTPEQAIMVGDSLNDVRTAQAAGVYAVAVSFGYPRMPVSELGADLLIDDFAQLPAAVLPTAVASA